MINLKKINIWILFMILSTTVYSQNKTEKTHDFDDKNNQKLIQHSSNNMAKTQNTKWHEKEYAKKPKIRVRLGKDIIIKGKVARKDIIKSIKMKINQIRSCYHRELNKNPNLIGKINIKWIINLDGKTKSTKIIKSSLKNKDLYKCIKTKMKRWNTKIQKTKTTKVFFSFTFTYN